MSCLARPDGKRQLTGAPTQAYVVILIHQRDTSPESIAHICRSIKLCGVSLALSPHRR